MVRKDIQVVTWMKSTLSTEILPQVLELNNAYDLWKALIVYGTNRSPRSGAAGHVWWGVDKVREASLPFTMRFKVYLINWPWWETCLALHGIK